MSLVLPYDAAITTITRLVPDPGLHKPRLGIVCGSGLSTLISSLKNVVQIPYSKIEGFADSTVLGQKSALAFGYIGKDNYPRRRHARARQFHPYEGYKPATVTYGIRVMKRLGVKDVIITNAAGSLRPEIPVGTIVVIQDHFALPNMTGMNPSFGPLTSLEYPRFLPLSNAYSTRLRRYAFLAAHDLDFPDDALAEGVYAWVTGPAYETPAEGRFLRNAGAHVVGMSTIPEVVAAREEKLDVMVLSLVTNQVVIPDTYRSIKDEVKAEVGLVMISDDQEDAKTPSQLSGLTVDRPEIATASHAEVIAVGALRAEIMRCLVERIAELVSSENQLVNGGG
ncbi:nucleoside phosphorylase domain-containing protein [Pisolithus croceorrhizus]|nr:nucleoside phosphorylase domain-containing protein [Pisolithus croceorrhizus]